MTPTIDIRMLRKPAQLKKVTSVASKQGNKFLYKNEDKAENTRLIENASVYWMGLQSFRERYERAWRYRRGKQWEDLVYDPDSSSYKKEETLIKDQGQIPFVVNLIGPNVRNIIGQFRSSNTRSNVIARTREDAPVGEMLTNTIKAVYDANKGIEKDAQALDIFLNSGMFLQKLTNEFDNQERRSRIKFRNVDINSSFFNPVKEMDLEDLNLIGSFYDLTVDDVIAKFARNKTDEVKIREMFRYVTNDAYNTDEHFTDEWAINRDFFVPSEPNKCRVYEIWENVGEWKYWCHDWANAKYYYRRITDQNKLKIDEENANRLMLAAQYGIPEEDVQLIEVKERFVQCWRCKFITPRYETLWECDSPYRHKSHPFALMLHPLIRGEVWGYTEDIIDLQRKFNRDHILSDYVIGASAKGTLFVPEEAITDDFPFEDIVETWSKRNGVVKIKLKQGAQMPLELTGKATPAGLHESMALVLQLMNSSSGVSDAIKGQTPDSGTPASRYAMEAQNSTISIKNYLDPFNNARCDRDKKLLELIIQYTKEKEYLPVSGQNYAEETKVFDPSKLRDDLTYTLQIDQGTDSRVYRALIDDQLFKWVDSQTLPLKIALKNSSLPFADKIMADLDEMEQQAQQGNIPQAGSAGIMPQLAQGLAGMGADPSKANPQALAMMQKHMGVPQA